MLTKTLNRLRSVGRDNSALAMVEFALTAPVLLSMGMLGTETAYYTITHMRVSQVAMQVADNASRVGEGSVLQNRRVFEDDITDVLIGAEKLGESFDIFENGRVIISSLQRNADGGQWIAWQRCRGAKQFVSRYGSEGTGASGTDFAGMGNPANPITASPGTAVMFVEISYTYEPITPFDLISNTELYYTGAFNVRDSRDLTRIHQRPDPVPVANCNVYSAGRPT
jgi:hypothetical protein